MKFDLRNRNLIFRKAMLLAFCVVGSCGYVTAQTFDWAAGMGGSSRGRAQGSSCVTRDAAGNIYLIGEMDGTMDMDPGSGTALLGPVGPGIAGSDGSVYLAKYDAQGKYLWAKVVISGAPASIFGQGLVLDEKGNIFLTGSFGSNIYFDKGGTLDSFSNTGSSPEVYMAQFDGAGNYSWLKTIQGSVTGSSPYIEPIGGITADHSGHIYITGVFDGSIDFDPGAGSKVLTSVSTSGGNATNCFIAKYDIKGNYVWANGIGGTDYAQGMRIAVDTVAHRNQVLVTGFFEGTIDFDPGSGTANLIAGGGADAFIAKYDSLGRYLWAKGFGGPALDNGVGISLGHSGNICIVGSFMGTSDLDPGPGTASLTATGFIDMFMATYDGDGNYIWANNIGALGAMTRVAQVNRDLLDNIYVGGSVLGVDVDFDPGPKVAAISSSGMADAYVAKYDACGNYVWAGHMGGRAGMGMVFNNGLSVSPEGEVVAAGDFDAHADFNPGTDSTFLDPAGGMTSSYLAKLTFLDTPARVHYMEVASCGEIYTLNNKTYKQSGTYTQLLPGTTSCDSVIVLKLTFYPPMDKPVIKVEGFTLSVLGSYAAYTWLKDEESIPGANGVEYTVMANGKYQVVVTNENGCTDTSEVYTVTNYTSVTDVAVIAAQIYIYPNPAISHIYIHAPIAVSVTITDVAGRLLKKQSNATSISVAELPKGIYLLNIYNKSGQLIKVEKLVKS